MEMVMAVEVIYTMGLCYVVLNVATTKTQAGNQYFGLSIGFVVVSAAVAIGGISNCCLNPAVAIGSLFAAFLAQGKSALIHIIVYFFTPFIGSIFAAVLFYLVRRKDEYNNQGFLLVKEEYAHHPLTDDSQLSPIGKGTNISMESISEDFIIKQN